MKKLILFLICVVSCLLFGQEGQVSILSQPYYSKDIQFASSTIVYADCNRTDTYIADGTVSKPYKSLSAITITKSTAIIMAPGTYTETGDMTFPNFPILIYGNHAVLNTTGNITINTPYFTRYDLFTTLTGTLTYNNFVDGARCKVDGGSITGNIVINSYVEFTECQLNGGIVSVGSGGQCVCNLLSPTSKFTSVGVLILKAVNMNTGKAGYLVTSTGGQLTIDGCILYNTSTNALAGCVSCDNGATSVVNVISNSVLRTAGQAFCVYSGSAYTAYSKNFLIGTATPVYGIALLPVTTDITGPGNIMALGSDATGDIYYRAATTGLLTRLAVGASGTVLTGGTVPSYVATTSLLTSGTVAIGAGDSVVVTITGLVSTSLAMVCYKSGAPLTAGTDEPISWATYAATKLTIYGKSGRTATYVVVKF
jgi:hypothetical protein